MSIYIFRVEAGAICVTCASIDFIPDCVGFRVTDPGILVQPSRRITGAGRLILSPAKLWLAVFKVHLPSAPGLAFWSGVAFRNVIVRLVAATGYVIIGFGTRSGEIRRQISIGRRRTFELRFIQSGVALVMQSAV